MSVHMVQRVPSITFERCAGPRRRTRGRDRAAVGGGVLVGLVILLASLPGVGRGNPVFERGFDYAALGRPVDLALIGSGELLVRTPDGLIPLPRGETDVQLDVTGIMVHGVVAQSFHNPTPDVIEVVYVFPLPERAAVHFMEMRIGERRIVSEIQERTEARRTYERARRTGRKAALIEQERPNLFTTSAANIGPGETITIRLEYYEELRQIDGEYGLTFPLTLTPRFVPLQLETVSALPVSAATALSRVRFSVPDAERVQPPFLPTLDDRGMWVTLAVRLDPGFPLATLESPSHRVRLQREGLFWEVDPQEGRLRADRDFHLRWRPRLSQAPQMSLFSEERGGERYALMMLLAPEPSGPGGLPTETFFIIDVSGSMQGPSIRQAREALLAALDRLRPGDAFNLLKFSNRHELFREDFQEAADPRALSAARRWVRSLDADGGTMIVPALLRGFRACAARQSDRQRRIILLTDAAVGNEDEVLQEVELRLGETRLYTVGIGRAPNRYLMERMASLGHGSCTFVATTSEAENQIDAFLVRIGRPVVTQADLVWHDAVVAEMHPDPLPDLHAGELLCVSVKLGAVAPGARVELRGRTAAGQIAQCAAFPPDAPHESGVAVRWARAKVRDLMGRLHRGAPREEVRAAVLAVAREFNLVTQYSSLVAVEQTRTVDGRGRTLPMPNTLPQGSHLLGAPQGGTAGRLHLLLGLALSVMGGALLAGRVLGRAA